MNSAMHESKSPAGAALSAQSLPPHQCFQPSADALRGRVIAVTGAGAGIGRAVALAAAAHGAELVLIGRTVAKLEAVHHEIEALQQTEASIAPLDLERAIARDYDQLADALQTRYGRLDGLVHNRVLHVNLTAAFALTQVLLPALTAAADASIVFTSSSVARRPRAYWGAYAVSKCGIEGLCRTLADELENSGHMRVNALNPGPVRTRMRAQAYPAEDPRTLIAPELIVRPYLWLLSAASAGVSGQSLDCQGA